MLLNSLVAAGVGTTSSTPNTQLSLRSGQLGDLIVSELHGRYYETNYRRNLFGACNQAAQVTTVALATTYTGICLSNTSGNSVNLVLNKIGIALSVAPAAIAPLALMGGASGTAVAHTTPLTPFSNFIGVGAAPSGKVDAAATLPITPTLLMPLMGGFTAAALPGVGPSLIDIEGGLIIPPGSFVALYSLTAVTGIFGFFWEEVPT